MRKVVGSNPSDAEFDHRFSFVDVSRGTTTMRSELGNDISMEKGDWPSIEKRRLKAYVIMKVLNK